MTDQPSQQQPDRTPSDAGLTGDAQTSPPPSLPDAQETPKRTPTNRAPWTREEARAFGAKGTATRLARRRLAQEDAQAQRDQREGSGPIFAQRVVARVRRQIDGLLDDIDAARQAKDMDAGQIDRLASAIDRLWGIEAQIVRREQRPTVRQASQQTGRRPSLLD